MRWAVAAGRSAEDCALSPQVHASFSVRLAMSKVDARRDFRYSVAVPVTIVSRTPLTLLTENVSFRGMFLRTDARLPKMHLLRVQIAVPTCATPIDTHVVVMTVLPAGVRAAGVGVAFFALEGEARKEWENFVGFVREQQISLGKSAEPALVAPRSPPPIVASYAAPPIVASYAAPPIVTSRAAPPLVASRAAPPLGASRAAPPLVVPRSLPPIVAPGADPVVATLSHSRRPPPPYRPSVSP